MNDKKILLIENSNYFGRVLKHRLETSLGKQVVWLKNLDELNESNLNLSNFNICLFSFSTDSHEQGITLNNFFEINLPVVLLVDEVNHEIQEQIWSYRVIDYVLKGSIHSIENIMDIINRFFTNHLREILIVDNSKESRNHLKQILNVHRYTVIEASNIEEALKILDNNKKIHMVITDYQPPLLDGLEITKEIRKKYSVDKIAIIGISARGNHSLKVQFIKSGANDFITKPFISELLYCRVIQNLKIVEYFQKLKDMALVDQLTELNNRHYLRETGSIIFENAKRNGSFMATAMIDIDDFKQINDLYGHDIGDIALKHLASLLKSSIRKSDLVCRYGGEEFIIIANNLNPKNALSFFEKIRTKIQINSIILKNIKINLTVSIGICLEKQDDLDQMINIADEKMYEAKKTGKNRVCM